MRERKRIRASADERGLRDILDSLREAQTAADITGHIAGLMDALRASISPAITIQAISEALRLTACQPLDAPPAATLSTAATLSPAELSEYFEFVARCIPRMPLDLSTFVSARIPALLRSGPLIHRFFSLYGKTPYNTNYLDDILVILIEESPAPMARILSLLPVPLGGVSTATLPEYILDRVHRLIRVSELTDDQYALLYSRILHRHAGHELRIVRGRSRLMFVSAAITLHPDRISREYSDDRDRRIRLLAAGVCTDGDVFRRLAHDPDESVRLALLDRLRWPDYARYDFFDRMLDRSYRVRQILFRIYREALLSLTAAGSSLFDDGPFLRRLYGAGPSGCEAAARSGVGVLSLVRLGAATADDSTGATDDSEAAFIRLVHQACGGCLTGFAEEYVSLLRESSFSLRFLSSLAGVPGGAAFLRSLRLSGGDFSCLPAEFLGLCLKYFYRGAASQADVLHCLGAEIFEVLPLIDNPVPLLEPLIRAATATADLSAAEQIAELIKPHIAGRLGPQAAVPFPDAGPLTPNQLLLGAHTGVPSSLVERVFSSAVHDYFTLYFLVYQARGDFRTEELLFSAGLALGQRVSLLLYYNRPDCLARAAPALVGRALDPDIVDRIQGARNLNSSLIYFLSTGLVSVSSPVFFVRAVRLAAHTSDAADRGAVKKDALRRILSKYVTSVEQPVFDVFYTICSELREYTTGPASHSGGEYVENPGNAAGTVGTAGTDDKKMRLRQADRVLWHVCETVMGLRRGVLVENPLCLERYGFTKLAENETEMLKYGQVVYV